MKAYFYSIFIDKLPLIREALKENDNLIKVLKKKALLLDTSPNLGKYLIATLFYLQEVEEMEAIIHSDFEDWTEIFFEVTDGATFLFSERTKKSYNLGLHPDRFSPQKLAQFYKEYADEVTPLDAECMLQSLMLLHKNIDKAERNKVTLLLIE
ncbi:MAG: hypothetical protein ACKVTZ_24120 [Bacteroidia bacterium]